MSETKPYIIDSSNSDTQNTVSEGNALVKGRYRLGTTELRLILLALSKINSRPVNKGGTPPNAIIQITVGEFAKVYGVSPTNVYRELKSAVKNIMRSPIEVESETTGEVTEIAWLSQNKYLNDDGSYVALQFSELIRPHVYELQSHFTTSNMEILKEISKSTFGHRLYRWLKSHQGKTQTKPPHKMTLTIKEIRERNRLTDTQYNRWSDFRKRVIFDPVNIINSKTDLYVMFEPIKRGSEVHAVEFTFAPNDIAVQLPARPRLKRRPKVRTNSHAEGEWVRENFKLLNNYRLELLNIDPNLQLKMPDLKRLAEYAKIVDPELKSKLDREIKLRKRK